MEKTIKKTLLLEGLCFLVSVGLAFLFHYLFEWSGKNPVVALFAPTNESVWEHSKLIFFPFLFCSLLCSLFIDSEKNFFFAKAVALSICIPLMLVLFYTYSGILGQNLLWVDILITVVVLFVMALLSFKIQTASRQFTSKVPTVVACLFIGMMFLFTFIQPEIALFLDTMTNTYGF